MAQQVALAKKPHVIVATPGRLQDHLENTKGFSLKSLKFLVSFLSFPSRTFPSRLCLLTWYSTVRSWTKPIDCWISISVQLLTRS